jgi:aryl-alcohol dehydrogenase-like predicted oxidoreductase
MSNTRKSIEVVVGTANWGHPYGLSGRRYTVDKSVARSIQLAATQLGIRKFDTAISYPGSSQILQSLPLRDWLVTTKIPEVPIGCDDIGGWVKNTIEQARVQIGVDQFDCVLLHEPGQLLLDEGKHLMLALERAIAMGFTARIGVSVYETKTLELLCMNRILEVMSVVQGPLNALNMRMNETGWVERLAAEGKEFQARSVFLQGVLLLPMGDLPSYFRTFDPILVNWWRTVETLGGDPIRVALAYVNSVSGVSSIVIGADSTTQLRQTMRAHNLEPLPISEFIDAPDELIDPRLWPPLSRPSE